MRDQHLADHFLSKVSDLAGSLAKVDTTLKTIFKSSFAAPTGMNLRLDNKIVDS